MPDTTRQPGPYLQLLANMALWGSAFAMSKVAVDEVPFEVAAFLRFGCGAVVLAAVAALIPRQVPGRGAALSARGRLRACLAGVLGVFAYNALFFWGLEHAPSIDGSIIVPVLSPILAISIGAVLHRERVSRGRAVGLAVGLVGAVVFFTGIHGASGGGDRRLVGELGFVLAAACWAIYTMVGPKVLADIEPLQATKYGTATGAVLLGLWSLPHLGSVQWSALPSGFWPNIAYLAVGPTAIAYALYYRGVRAVGTANASIMMFTVPVFGAACSALVLGESMTPLQATGGAIMLGGAVLAVTRGRLPLPGRLRRRHPSRQPAGAGTGPGR